MNVAHPASMKTPPNGVTGPRKRNLGGFQSRSTGDADNEAHLSLSVVNPKMEPENKIVPPMIAGPANL